jgi:uncharacterized protein (TIGR02145 family)
MKNFIRLFSIICLLISLSNCKKDESSIENYYKVPQAFPDIEGEIVTFHLYGDTITCRKINNEYVFQNDILLVEDQLKDMINSKGAGLSSLSKRWPGGIVYYKIGDDLPNQTRVTTSINHYNDETNLRFVQRTNETNYVEFVKSSILENGTSSRLGMIGGRQTISLADGADVGDVIHEIGHTIGLIHEHARSDRDNYVIVNLQNIKLLYRNDFSILKNTVNTTEFDFGSIMMYPSFTGFEIDPSIPSITLLDGTPFPVFYQSLSQLDIKSINLLYSGSSPDANFSASATNIYCGESIRFSDQTTNNPINWYWSFGDGNNSTQQNPVYTYNKTGTFEVSLKATNIYDSDLEIKPNYIKVIALNDLEGNVYKTVKIGNQTWMVENLKTTKYNNGDLIGTTNPATFDISGETLPKYQWAYDGIESNVNIYGRLYTWYTVTDSRKICPTGWHVPTDGDWLIMENYLISNGYNYDGTTVGNKIAKSLSATNRWISSSITGAPGNIDYPSYRNLTGFTALPGGFRDDKIYYLKESFCIWWSSVEDISPTGGWSLTIYSDACDAIGGYAKKSYGLSVRCLKDN